MADPMKIRTTVGAEYTEVRVLMVHPMETGQRKDSGGNLIPIHFIQEMSVKLNGKTVLEGQISQAVSRNPVFSFRLKGAKSGDKLEIAWLDNRGERNRTETAIA
ncbi:MAG TPA: thiosulfate oxidation carrier complex protein SoxZ [Burkholderiales bacterium]|jgi:sulfur-oxidizing protein SoxZ|nr:thiosulfate oxidation carrier complex protein SoxZ [Burkholderiales bacterium]